LHHFPLPHYPREGVNDIGIDGAVASRELQVHSRGVHMARTVSIVAARRELGRLADEVRRTGQPVILTRRGRAVARIAPEANIERGQTRPRDAFAELRGTVRLHCDFDELQSAIRALRREFGSNLDRRAATLNAGGARRRG